MINWVVTTYVIGTAKAAGFDLGLPLLGDKFGTKHYNTFNAYFTDLVGLIIDVASGVAVLTLIYAGFAYSQSQGDPKRVAQAKEWAIGTLTGLALLLLIRLILPTLNITPTP